MNAKNVISVILLGFVAVAIGYVLMTSTEPLEQQTTAEAPAAPGEATQPDGIKAYYFHGDRRCATCQKIEDYTAEAVKTGFADALASGAVTWDVLNFEDPANADVIKDYNLVSQAVILVQWKNGEKLRWKSLDQIWELVGDKAAFTAHIQEELTAFMAGK